MGTGRLTKMEYCREQAKLVRMKPNRVRRRFLGREKNILRRVGGNSSLGLLSTAAAKSSYRRVWGVFLPLLLSPSLGNFFYPCWMPFLDQINHRREVFNKFQVFKTFTRLFQYHLVAQNFLYRIMYFIKILRIIWKNGKLIKLSRHFRAGSVVECGAAARSGKSESADSS